jgi:hypothetical protein
MKPGATGSMFPFASFLAPLRGSTPVIGPVRWRSGLHALRHRLHEKAWRTHAIQPCASPDEGPDS